MSILDSIVIAEVKAPRITLYGKPGVGKSTLAANFPNPLFLLTEENEIQGVPAIRPPATFKEFWQNVQELQKIDLPYQTIIIDSISMLDTLVINHILEAEGDTKKTLASACGGYGAGYMKAQSMHRALKAQMDKFRDKGIAVIYIAHSVAKTVKAPDLEDYEIYTIVMNNDKSREVYIDDVDMVGFCKQKSVVIENESGRNLIKSSKDRIVNFCLNEANVSKNRYGIAKEDLPMDAKHIMELIPYYARAMAGNNSSDSVD